jgi:glucosamine-6-phosphate deaminase
MRLVITKDYAEMAEWGARYIKKRINDFKPGPDRFFVLGLPTGMFRFYFYFLFLSNSFFR